MRNKKTFGRLFRKILFQEDFSSKYEDELIVETSLHEEILGEDISFVGRPYSKIKDHLLFNYRYKNTSFTEKYPVTDPSKLNTYKFIDLSIAESKHNFLACIKF